MAGDEAVHRRRARGRGLDGARRHRPVTAPGSATRSRTSRATGLSFQRSQNGGRLVRRRGRTTATTSASDVGCEAPARRSATSSTASTRRFPALFTMLGRPEPAGAAALLQRDRPGGARRDAGVRSARSVGRRLRCWRSACGRAREAGRQLGPTPTSARSSTQGGASSRWRSPPRSGWSSRRSRSPPIRRSRPDPPRRSPRRR